MADRLRIERDTDGLLVLLTAEGFEVAIVQTSDLLADLLALLPVEVARPVVRAYLARNPESERWCDRFDSCGTEADHPFERAGRGERYCPMCGGRLT